MTNKASRSVSEKIIHAFIQVCKKESLPKVTLQKVAKQADIPFATAHYHWGGRMDDLVSQALQLVSRNAQLFIENYLDESVQTEDDLVEAYARGTFLWIEKHLSEAQLWVYFYYHCANNPKLGQQSENLWNRARLRVQRLISESIGSGHWKSPHSIPELAAHIHTLVFGNVIMAIASGSLNARSELCRLTLTCIKNLNSKSK